MAITLRGATTAGTGSSTTTASYTIAKPSGVQPGDVLLIYIVIRGTNAASTPAGFTAITATQFSSTDCQLFYKVADGTEGSTFTLSWTGSNTSTAVCLAYAGVNSAIFDPAAPAASGAAGTVNGVPTATGITTTHSGDTLVWFAVTKTSAAGSTPGTISPPAGFVTEAAQVSTSTGADPNVAAYAADMTQSSAGATGTLAGTNTSGTDRADALVIALFAAAVAGGQPGPAAAKLPRPVLPGRHQASKGAPVQNPTSGPVFRQAVQPARAQLPRPQFFPRGRVSGNRGGPVRNPTSGPVFRPDTVMQAQRAVIPQRPRGGRVASNPGGPVRNPVAAVVLAQAGASLPAATRNPYSRLIVAISPPAAPPPTDLILIAGESSPNSVIEPVGASVPAPLSPRSQLLPNPVWQGPQFFPAVQAVRARFPLLPLLRGRVASNPGAPVRNPVAGPVFRQAVQAFHAIRTLPVRGRIWSGPGAPVPPPAAVPSSPGGPARARILPPLRGRAGSSRTAPVIPVIPARILVTAGQPYTRWETGIPGQAPRGPVPGPPVPGPAVPGMAVPGAFTPGYPGAPTRILVTAGQPYTRWETGQPVA